MRSHLLAAGTGTTIDVAFHTVVDGPGIHGEVIRIVTRPALRPAEPSEITFLIRVEESQD